MEVLALTLSPILVAVLTGGVKKLKTVKISGYKKTILRLVVGVLSFGSVVAGAVVTGGEVDAVSIETLSNTILVFLSASGVYLFAKKPKPTE
jgi:hypothetical protein